MLIRLLTTVRGGLRRPYLLLALAASLALLSTGCYNLGGEDSWMRGQDTGAAAQPIAVLMAKDVDKGGGFYAAAGETVALNAGSDKLFLPVVLNRNGSAQDWSSRFIIQNMGDQTACATLVYTSNQTDSEVYWDPYDPKIKNPTRQPGCPKGGMPIPPNGSLLRNWFTMGVEPAFQGSVRVDLHANAQNVPPSQQYIVATADIFNSLSRQLASYRGLSLSA